MDIYQRLKDDHGKQRGLLGGLEDTTGDSDERKRLFQALKEELEAHAAAEEQTFYAELIATSEAHEKARHSVAEHKEADDLIEELSSMDMSEGGWLIRFRHMRERLEHHVKEEEEEVFPLAKKLISDTRATELAEEFEKKKKESM